MNTSQTKLLAWTAAGVLGFGLSLYVGWFVSRRDEIQRMVTKEEMQAKLEDVVEILTKADDIVAYPMVRSALIELDWSGRPQAVAQPVSSEPEQVQPAAVPMAELVKVMFLSFASESPADSMCILRYTPAAQVRAAPTPGGAFSGFLKKPGDALEAPLDHVRVFAVHPESVEFAFADASREHERVAPGDYDLRGIVQLSGEGEVQVRSDSIAVPRVSVGQSVPRTLQLDDGIYQIGWEDAQRVGENYAEILSSEVRTVDHRDPRSGRRDGIQLLDVAPGSIAESHGLSGGDVVKSINGHAVTSKQEAITFVKNNKDLYDKWEVVVESKGRLKTLVYYSPKK